MCACGRNECQTDRKITSYGDKRPRNYWMKMRVRVNWIEHRERPIDKKCFERKMIIIIIVKINGTKRARASYSFIELHFVLLMLWFSNGSFCICWWIFFFVWVSFSGNSKIKWWWLFVWTAFHLYRVVFFLSIGLLVIEADTLNQCDI